MRRERERLGRENSNIEVAFKIVKNEFVLITDISSLSLKEKMILFAEICYCRRLGEQSRLSWIL
jgi:hypothetical protein